MSATDKTAEEVMQSLTGFDEIAIAQRFGAKVLKIAKEDETSFLRSLVFIEKRREGLKDGDAWQAVMEMPLAEVQEYFPDDDEFDPDEPDTASGKGSMTPATALTT
jgi:hypothetical protein